METKSWKKIKDSVYGEIGTERRDGVERDFESFKIGLLLRNAREQKNLTQEQLGAIINKKRSYISRVENDGSNVTMKTLYDIVEKGLGGKVKISFEIRKKGGLAAPPFIKPFSTKILLFFSCSHSSCLIFIVLFI